MRFFIVSALVFVFSAIPLVSFAWVPGQPIVPSCQYGGGTGPYCQACDLVQLVNNLLGFAIYFSAFVATVMFAYAGFLYVTAASNQENLTKAKNIFGKVLLGFVFVLTAWLIVDIILSVFTEKNFGFWSDIKCERFAVLEDATGTTVGVGGGGGVSSGTCEDCENITAFNCKNPRSCQVPPEVNEQLEALNEEIVANGGDLGDYIITETGVNTTVTHRSGSANLDISCRGSSRNSDGTCTSEWVSNTTLWGGSSAVYETNSQADYDAKIKAGIPSSNVLLLGTFNSDGSCSNSSGCITSPHSSLNP